MRMQLMSFRSLALVATLLAGLTLSLVLATGGFGIAQLQIPPDPCVVSFLSFFTLEQINLPAPGNGLRIIVSNNVLSQLPNNAHVVLIVNGNGFDKEDYQDLATFLARNGFIAVIAQREGFNQSEVFVIEALEATFAELGLKANTPVALVGHSVGGDVVVDAAIHNYDTAAGFNIQAVVGLAPNVSIVEDQMEDHLTGDHTPAYLLIYGSQDEDVEGDGPTPHEAFASYDSAGTENSTTCNSPPCLQLQPPFERTMIYIHGAGHGGLIRGVGSQQGANEPISAYLEPLDQLCITKGYINAFLRWKLRDEIIHKRTVRGDYRPPSIASITTSGEDYKGNPAGSPLRLFFQVSPMQRRAIENFEDGEFDLFAVSPEVVHQVAEAGDFAGSPHYVRHQTNFLIVGWPDQAQNQWIGFNVPPNARNTTHFSHLGLRLGQFKNPDDNYANPINADQTLQICLFDDSHASCQWSNVWGAIPPNDPQPDGVAHSVMNTIPIRLSAFQGIDRANVEAVLLFIPADAPSGTIMVDSLEWFRD